MLPEEALRIRKSPTFEDCDNEELSKCIDEALEKQVAKYTLKMPPNALYTICPICERGCITRAMNYCPKCGNKLDWSD